MNHAELQIKRRMPLRVLISLAVGLLAFVALGFANPHAAHAGGVGGGGGGYSPGPGNYLVFYCEYSLPPNHPLQVWVEGYNQNATLVAHTFPAYYTYDRGYWWWLQGSTVWYQSLVSGRGWGPVHTQYMWINGYTNNQSVLDPDC